MLIKNFGYVIFINFGTDRFIIVKIVSLSFSYGTEKTWFRNRNHKVSITSPLNFGTDVPKNLEGRFRSKGQNSKVNYN